MCCFTMPIEDVGGTRIFVRAGAAGRQFLVYSMEIAPLATASLTERFRSLIAGDPNTLAMVLPLPVPPRSPEDAVRFISLEKYPRFFDDLNVGFQTRETPMVEGPAVAAAARDAAPALVVHRVGGFE